MTAAIISQTDGIIGPTGPWALPPAWAPSPWAFPGPSLDRPGPSPGPWAFPGPPWAFPGPSLGLPPHKAPPKAAEREKLTMKLIWCAADQFCLKTNLFGAWGAQGLFGGLGLASIEPCSAEQGSL